MGMQGLQSLNCTFGICIRKQKRALNGKKHATQISMF